MCDKTCIFCFFRIINKYLCMAKRSLLSRCPSYLSHAVTGDSAVKGCVLKNSIPVTPSLCNVSFSCYNLAFDLWVF